MNELIFQLIQENMRVAYDYEKTKEALYAMADLIAVLTEELDELREN